MKIQTGIIKGRETKSNRDGARDVLLLQVELTDKNDVQTVELMQGSGDQYNPENGSKVLVVSDGSAYKIAIAVDDMTAIALEVGERAIRSVLGGEVKSSVLCKTDGNVVINEGDDFAIQFSALKDIIDALVIELDNHIHTAPSSGGPTTKPLAPFNFDMTPAKIEKVRLP
jgi:phage gp45-like